MFSICEYFFHMQIKFTLIYNQKLADVQRRGKSVCIIRQRKSLRCSAARQFCLYNEATDISPMFSGEVILVGVVSSAVNSSVYTCCAQKLYSPCVCIKHKMKENKARIAYEGSAGSKRVLF